GIIMQFTFFLLAVFKENKGVAPGVGFEPTRPRVGHRLFGFSVSRLKLTFACCNLLPTGFPASFLLGSRRPRLSIFYKIF
ncbi:MAG: hypothetical protein QW795_06140, partial [Candidatus Bathyarchaeia archaeon]